MNKIIDFLKQLVSGVPFTSEQMYELFALLTVAPKSQQVAILSVLASRGETVDELTGALRYFLEQAVPFNYPKEVIEIVGTGGDALKTFNISTAASLVIASCGIKVAKHGGRASTSASGGMDLLEALHIPLYDNVDQIYHSLNEHNYAALWGPLFNPILKSLAPLRKELGIPTMLNILGPIANPMRPKRQVVGVYRKDLVLKLAQVLQRSGSIHAIVVHSHDGLDELSISAPTYVAELKNDSISQYEVSPEVVGLKRGFLHEIIGGSPKENAKIIMDIFSGKQMGAPLDIVLFNAAAGLLVSDRVASLSDGVLLAREAVQSGKTLQLIHNITETKL